jgi:hypothetical protein
MLFLDFMFPPWPLRLFLCYATGAIVFPHS